MLDIANQKSDIIPHTSYVRHKTKYIRLQTAGIRTQMSPLIKHVFQLTSKARGWELMSRKWGSGRHSRNHGQRAWRPTGWEFSTEKFLALIWTCTCNLLAELSSLLMLLPIPNQLLGFDDVSPLADPGLSGDTRTRRRCREEGGTKRPSELCWLEVFRRAFWESSTSGPSYFSWHFANNYRIGGHHMGSLAKWRRRAVAGSF